jgi:hypothetical protein
MSKQWGHGFHNGMAKGQQFGEQVGEAKTQMNLGMKALCLATAIREAQKTESVSQYVLCEVLIDLLANECGGRLDGDDEQDATPNVTVRGVPLTKRKRSRRTWIKTKLSKPPTGGASL